MLTLNEIANVSFRKSNFAGYKPEDVDEFIDKVVESYDLLIKKNIEQKEINEKLTAENERLKTEAKASVASAPAPVAPHQRRWLRRILNCPRSVSIPKRRLKMHSSVRRSWQMQPFVRRV